MTTHDREKKSRVARDFRRVLIVLVIIFVAILGRQEYKNGCDPEARRRTAESAG